MENYNTSVCYFKQIKGSFVINENISKIQIEEKSNIETMHWSLLTNSTAFSSIDELYEMNNFPIMEDLDGNKLLRERSKIEGYCSDSVLELNGNRYLVDELEYFVVKNNKFENITVFVDSDNYINEVITKSPDGYFDHELEEQTVN